MENISWLLMTYKVPPEPAAKRVSLWRKLKGMGALYLQNGFCILPKTDEHVRCLKMLENDISEAQGELATLETVAVDPSQETKVFDAHDENKWGLSHKTLTHTQPSLSIGFAPYLLATANLSTFSMWVARQQQCRHLSQLDKHMLDDIGLNQVEAKREVHQWT